MKSSEIWASGQVFDVYRVLMIYKLSLKSFRAFPIFDNRYLDMACRAKIQTFRPRGQVFSAHRVLLTVKVFKISLMSFGAFKIIANLVSRKRLVIE